LVGGYGKAGAKAGWTQGKVVCAYVWPEISRVVWVTPYLALLVVGLPFNCDVILFGGGIVCLQ